MADSTPDSPPAPAQQKRKKSSLSSSKPHPERPMRLLMNRARTSRGGSSAALAKEMDTIEGSEPTTPPTPTPPETTYGYLEHIRGIKPDMNPEDKSLPKKVREYYEEQVELITGIEDILVPKGKRGSNATDFEKRQQRNIKILTYVVLVTNIILFIIKIAGAVISKSLSVISSVVDSAVDLLTSVILLWTAHKIKKRDLYEYPGGRTRLEPIAVVVLSVIMCSASVAVILESVQTLAQDVEYLSQPNHSNCSSTSLPDIDMSTLPIVAMVLTIVSKSVLFVLCYRIKNPSMYALAEDSRNDVASNIVALICGLIASNALAGKLKLQAIVVDPVGAIVISVYIITAWILQANEQIRNLSGLVAEPNVIQKITHVVYNFRPDVCKKIDSIHVFHLGTNYCAEVDIVLPKMMPLNQAHDIGAELQNRLEAIEDIERAYVHLDFEYTHDPHEHKVL